jgi:hypothetical protein
MDEVREGNAEAEVAAALERLQRIETELRHRSGLERLVASASTRLVSISEHNRDTTLEWVLKNLGEFTGVDRCYLFALPKDTGIMVNTHEFLCARYLSTDPEPAKFSHRKNPLAGISSVQRNTRGSWAMQTEFVKSCSTWWETQSSLRLREQSPWGYPIDSSRTAKSNSNFPFEIPELAFNRIV